MNTSTDNQLTDDEVRSAREYERFYMLRLTTMMHFGCKLSRLPACRCRSCRINEVFAMLQRGGIYLRPMTWGEAGVTQADIDELQGKFYVVVKP